METRIIIITLLVLMIMMVGSIIGIVRAEEITPHVVCTRYDGHELIGLAEVPDGEWWARITMYVDGDAYIVIFAPVRENGTFQTWVFGMCRYLTVAITDYPIIDVEAHGAYETWPVLAWE